MSKDVISSNSITGAQDALLGKEAYTIEKAHQSEIEALPHMVWSARADGCNDYQNNRWYEFTGLSPATVHDDAWIDLVHPADRAAVLDVWQKVLKAGSECEIEHRLRHHSGECR